MNERSRWSKGAGAWSASRLTRLVCCALVLTGALLLAHAAQAQGLNPNPAAPEPSAVQRETARAWVLEGRRSFAAQDYTAALERYAAAYQLVRAPTVGLEMARAQEALGRWVEANATAAEVINLPRSEPEPAVFDQAREAARELLRSLSPRIPALQLELSPAAVEAQVVIDGEALPFPRGAMPFRLNPGTHQLQVLARGYRPELRTVTLVEQQLQVLSIELMSEQPPVMTVRGGSERPALAGAATEDEAGSGARTRGHVALGVAGIAGLLGSVTGVLAFSSKPDCPGDICTLELRDEAQRSRRFGNVATASFGVALVAAAYGGWELLVNAPRASAPALRAALVPRDSGAALQLSGAF